MGKLVSLIQPVLLWLSTSHEVKKLVVELLKKYAHTTDNDVDDLIVATVEKALLGHKD